ncbi:hypothetical protein ACFQJ5_05955 [Halomicroarcula sp. GCM10025324]|uniref:DUF7573 domain-containing protein n=1 Tax=Haloarcula TaxID=2237 RepID=UPI0023E8B9F9|nr:hypothetical protein [Halomicroarcula sp. ZS-22-S1]
MVEDASLDDFLGSGDDDADEERDTGSTDADGSETERGDDPATDAGTAETEAGASDEEADSTDGDDGETAPEDGRDVAPATTTYAWSDEGTTCEECGAPAERRWQQDGALVCPDCKVW